MNFAHAYEGLWRSYVQGLALSDPDWLAALFAEEGVILSPGVEPVIGRSAIREYQVEYLQAFEIELEMQTAEARELGDKGWGYGTFTMQVTPRSGGDPVSVKGNYLNLVQAREDGTLEIVRHCWNTHQPLPHP